MKKSFRAKLALALALLMSTSSSAFGAEELRLEPCRVVQADKSQVLRIGFPKAPGLMEPQGSPKLLVVGVDFRDAPMTLFKASELLEVLEIRKVTERYEFVSRGKFSPEFELYPSWLRMPELSSHYGSDRNRVELVNGEWSTHHLAHDVNNYLRSEINLSEFDGILIFVPRGEVLSGLASYSTILDSEIIEDSGGIGSYIVLGGGWSGEEQVEIWRVIVHEINHLIGLPDLYLYEPDGYWKGRTPGPFGQQAFVFESSSDSLGWNRWLNGWVEDSQVNCEANLSDIKSAYLSPPNDGDDSGYEIIVLRLSGSKVMVIEALNETGYGSLTYKNSLLVYIVDTTINSGFGPVTIVPRPTPLTLSPLTPSLPDWIRFREAPLIPNSYVDYENILIVNQQAKNKGALLSIYMNRSDAEKAKIFAEIENKKSLSTNETKQVIKKTITCIRGKSIKKISGVKPKCPIGYKKK